MANYPIPNRVPLPTMNPGQGGMMGAFPPAPAAPTMQAQAPSQQGQGGGIRQWLGNNSEALAAMSKGLLTGRTGSEQFAQGFGGFVDARAAGKKKTRTMEFLAKQDPMTAQAVELGLLTGPEAFKAIYDSKNKPTEYQQRAQAAQQYGIDPNTPEGRAFVLTGKLKGADGDGTDYGLNPQYGVDEEGNPVIMQLGKDGTSIKTPLPPGVKLSKEPIKIDAGTHIILLDPITRQSVGMIPKENRQEAFDKGLGGAEGKAAGEAAGSYRSIESKMPGLEQVVQRLEELADKATYTYAGQGLDAGMRQLGIEPREAAVARTEYQAMVDNQVLPMLRDTFGAAFTVKEGETLRATLGDLNKSPTERKAILRAFIEQKRRDVEALARQSGMGTPQAAPQGGPRKRYNPQTGRIE